MGVLLLASNSVPLVNAGGVGQTISARLPGFTTLYGSAIDDGLPDPPAALTYLWTQQSGPGTATFVDETDPLTVVSFDAYGAYVLRLSAYDGEETGFDEVTITIIELADIPLFPNVGRLRVTGGPPFPVEFDLATANILGLLSWLEWYHVDASGNPKLLVYAKVPLDDPGDV